MCTKCMGLFVKKDHLGPVEIKEGNKDRKEPTEVKSECK